MQFPELTTTQIVLGECAKVWRLWLPLLLLLVGVGWATRQWLGGKLLLISLVLLAVFTTKVTLVERKRERATIDAWNGIQVRLSEPVKVDGLNLASGTIVRWSRERPGHLLTAELGAGQEVIPGAVLMGEADQVREDSWEGTLSKDSTLRGWFCAAGKIDLDASGQLRWCVLAGPRRTAAGEIPKGTAVLLDPGEPSDVLLHLPNVGMRAGPGGFLIAPHDWVVLYSDGELLAVPGPVVRRGVALGADDSSVVLRYGDEDLTRWYGLTDSQPTSLVRPPGPVTGWRGDLFSSLTCEGELKKGRRVTIPISGDIVTATHMDSTSPRARPVLDSYHCVLGPEE